MSMCCGVKISYDTQHNDTQHEDIQHGDAQNNNTKRDTRHESKSEAGTIMLSVVLLL